MTERLNALGLEFERISAFDGKLNPTLHLVAWWKAIIFNFMARPSAGVIGCYQSHRFVWQKIVDDQISQALVFEDDAVSTDWDPAILGVRLADLGLELLRLEATDFRQSLAPSTSRKLLGRQLYNIQTSGAAAYIITEAGARKCLSLGKFWFPADTYDLLSRLTGLKTALLFPVMWQQSGSASDLRKPELIPETSFEKTVSICGEIFWCVRRPWLRAARNMLVSNEVRKIRNKVVDK